MVDRHSGTAAAGPSDVVVMGAGIAGLAAATHLARAGRRVTCVEPERFPRARVGESLDWSSPWLLRRLGYRSEELVDQGFATYKCDIEAASPDQAPLAAHPPRILSRRPFGAQMTTVHLDRERFDRSLYERARDGGVEFVWDAVGKVEMEGDRVLGCVTRSGLRLEADWFIDATGPSRLIGRAAGIGVREYAVPRVCLWTQATAPRARAGTTLSLDTTKEQLEWVWEIPLAEDRQSLGLVMPSRAFRALERRGRSKAQILAEQLARFPRYASLEPDDLGEVRTRSYRPYVSDRVVGANWLMAGEAAAMIDPLTSFGVTAALRNGSEAASIITGTHGRAGTQRALADYDRRVRTLGDLYNSAIEALIYEPRVRMAFGLRAAGIAYVLVGYGTNTLYTRLRPTTATKTAVLAIIASAFRLWRRAWLVAADRGGTRQARSAATD
ncbi:MAG: FAD-dependent oxidoreductase [Chloroflexota bacterium]